MMVNFVIHNIFFFVVFVLHSSLYQRMRTMPKTKNLEGILLELETILNDTFYWGDYLEDISTNDSVIYSRMWEHMKLHSSRQKPKT